MSQVPGFPREIATFLSDLGQNNSKAWFDANRATYQSAVIEPTKDFITAIGPLLAQFAPGVHTEPRVNGSIMRLNRDVRFSKDKSPYRDWLGIWFWQGAGRSRECPGLYMRIDARELILGVGMHMFGPPQLERYRAAVADETRAKALRAALTEIARVDGMELGGSHYKKVPRGFPADHPQADLLRHNALYAGVTTPLPGALFSPAAPSYCADVLRRLYPLQAWLVATLDP